MKGVFHRKIAYKLFVFCLNGLFLLDDAKSPHIVLVFFVVAGRVRWLAIKVGKKCSFIQTTLLIEQHVRGILLELGTVTLLQKPT